MASDATTISNEASRAVEAAERGARESVSLLERAARSTLELAGEMADRAPRVVAGLIVLVGAYFIARATRRAVTGVFARMTRARHVDVILGRIAGASVFAIGALVALSTMGIRVGALVTSLGIVGVAVGLALREILANWLAGVLLLLERPFKIGDTVEIGAVSGTVRDIRIRDTVIEAPDGRVVFVPNLSVFTNNIANASVNAVRRTELPVSLPLGSDIAAACDAATVAADKVACVVSTPAPEATVLEIAPDGVRLVVRAWIDTADCGFADVRRRVALAVTEAVAASQPPAPAPAPSVESPSAE